METIRAPDFARRFAGGAAICGTDPANWQEFSRWYCTHLDSFTSLLAIFDGTLVPFQAYVDEDQYVFLNNAPNLVRRLRRSGFSTQYVSSYGEHHRRFIPHPDDWDEAWLMQDLEHSPFTVVTSNPIEEGAEDLAALDRVIEALGKDRRVFLFQEMVFGHTQEWQNRTGIAPVDYYLRYFGAFFSRAAAAGLLDRTLVCIVADHGPRLDAWDVGNYHVPMWFWARDLAGGIDDRFLSHLDFAAVLEEIAAGGPSAASRQGAVVVGPASEFLYGWIGRDGGRVLISNRTLHVNSTTEDDWVRHFHKKYQRYVDEFVGLPGFGSREKK